MTIEITGGVLAVAAAGAYLRWGLVPVRCAYGLGKRVEQLRQAHRAGRAVLEYLIAVLVAAIEDLDDDQVRKLATHPGEARKALNKLVTARPERPDLGRLYQDAKAVIEDRHVIVHSVALADVEARGEPGLGIWNPRYDNETRITTPQVLDHAHDIRIVARRARSLIAAEISARLPRDHP